MEKGVGRRYRVAPVDLVIVWWRTSWVQTDSVYLSRLEKRGTEWQRPVTKSIATSHQATVHVPAQQFLDPSELFAGNASL